MQPDQMSQTSTTSAVKSRRALELLDAVRTMTPQNIHVAFLSILSSFRKKEISTKQVHSQVNDLLRDYPVLLEKFASFLPPPSTATSVIQNEPTAAPIDTTETNQMKISDAVNFIEAVQKAYATRPHVYNMFLQLMQEYKRDTSRMQPITMVKELLSERPDLVAQFVLFCPIEKVDAGSCLPPLSTASVVNNDPVAFPINTTQAGFLQYSHAIDFVTAVKNALFKNISETDPATQYFYLTQPIMEIQELLSDRPDLVAQFMLFTDPAQNVDAEKAATFKRQGSADTLDQVHVSIPTETTALLSPLNSHVSKRQVSVCAIVGWMLLVLVVIAFVALYLVNIVKIQLAYE